MRQAPMEVVLSSVLTLWESNGLLGQGEDSFFYIFSIDIYRLVAAKSLM
jgi:hypothetical protein